MNYVEFYPGDYKRDTARLSLAEHGAYTLLLADYYAGERALPKPYADLYRIANAQGAAEQKAVRLVADHYFPVGEDGLRHNTRADKEIAKAQKRIKTARENGAKNKPGKNPAGDPVGMPAGDPQGTQRDTPRHTQSGEALHTPHATSQGQASGHTPSSLEGATNAGRACRLMRDAGCMRTNPSHANLVAALAAGITPEALGDTAREGVEAGKTDPFAWAITTAVRRHSDAQRPTITGPPKVRPQSQNNLGMTQILAGTHHDPNSDPDLVLDADPRGPGDALRTEPRRISGG